MEVITITGEPNAGLTSAESVLRERFDENAGGLRQTAQPIDGPKQGDKAPLLVSACLLGEPCRYDANAQPCEAVIETARTRKVVPVCPEQLGGLPTPRTPSEIQPDGRVLDAKGVDRTTAFETGAREALRIARENGCEQAILKENSPSCGMHRIYDGTFSGTIVPGQGKAAALLSENGIALASEADIH